MSVSGSRVFVAWVMTLVFPLSVFAADTGSAMLHSNGGVLVNGSEIADASAIFVGDVLETKPGFVANLDVDGSSVLIQAESIVKFEGDHLDLEHGSVAVGTSTSMSVHVKCLRVEPVSNDRTQYDVADRTGRVEVAAHKNDVIIEQTGPLHKTSVTQSDSATVHEGQQASRDDSVCGAAKPPEAAGNGINTKWLEVGGGVGGGALALCLLLCRGKSQPNASPSQPN